MNPTAADLADLAAPTADTTSLGWARHYAASYHRARGAEKRAARAEWRVWCKIAAREGETDLPCDEDGNPATIVRG